MWDEWKRIDDQSDLSILCSVVCSSALWLC